MGVFLGLFLVAVGATTVWRRREFAASSARVSREEVARAAWDAPVQKTRLSLFGWQRVYTTTGVACLAIGVVLSIGGLQVL